MSGAAPGRAVGVERQEPEDIVKTQPLRKTFAIEPTGRSSERCALLSDLSWWEERMGGSVRREE